MATWGWGQGCKDFGPVDHHEVYPTRVFDGDVEVLDWIDFIDDEKGIYRVLVTDPPTPAYRLTTGAPAPPFKIVNDNTVTVIKHAKHKLKVLFSEE